MKMPKYVYIHYLHIYTLIQTYEHTCEAQEFDLKIVNNVN